MNRVAVPNLVTSWKARVGAAVLGFAIGLTVLLVTGDMALSAITLSGSAILISAVRYRQERASGSQASPSSASDSN